MSMKIYSNDPRNSQRFNRANLTRAETLARHYGLNHEFQEYLDHATGISHTLATYNAKVCTSATLRLYKVMLSKSRGQSAGLNARSIPSAKMKAIKSGHHGFKAASYAESGAEMLEVTTHPLLDLLQSPNPIMPGTMLEHLKWYMNWIGGNAYEYKSMQNGVPFMLSPMLSQFVSIEADIESGVTAFNYGRSRDSVTPFSPDEVIHYKLYPSPHSALYGIGAMYGVLPHMDMIQNNLIHDISMAKNGMHPDGIWMLPEGTTDQNAAKFENQLKSKFRGIKDYWKHLIFSGKVEFVSPQFGEKDLMTLPKLEHSEKAIRQAFGHTESMADSTDTNVASAIQSHDKQFLGGTIWPALLNDAAFKNAQLLPDFGLDPDVYFVSYDNPIERDEALYSDRLRADVMGGIRTINEARVEMGLSENPDEFADRLLVNGQPLGAVAAPADPFGGLLGAMAPKPAESTAGAEDSQVDDSTPDEPVQLSVDDKRATVLSAAKSFVEPMHWRDCPTCSKAQDPSEMAPDDILREAMGGLADEFEASMSDVLADAQSSLVQALYEGASDDEIHNLERILSDQAAEVLGEAMIPVMEFGGQEMTSEIGGPELAGTFQITDQRAVDFLRDYTIGLADDIMGTTADIAKRAVSAGLEMGLTESEVVGVMVENGIAENRATMIARTETQRAVQNGKRQAMIQLDIEQVRWVNAPGASKAHQIIASRSPKPIDEPFVKAGETIADETYSRDIYVPPARPNCRCSILAVFEDD